MDELFRFVGQINFSLSRLTFIVSQFLYDIKIEDNPHAFFANIYVEDKFKKLPSRLKQIDCSTEITGELNDWTDELIELIRRRNTLTHSLILTSLNDRNNFRLYIYRVKEKKIEPEVVELNLQEVSALNSEFIKIHNEGCILFEKIENHVRSKTKL